MSDRPFSSSVAGALLFIVLAASLAFLPADPAGAHGSLADPASRVYACRFLVPDNPMCAEAWDANPQALYDWMEVNLGDAAGRHQELIPDGELCSAGREKYAAFDVPSDAWPAQQLTPLGDDTYRFVYEASAPHATEYFWLYVTTDGYDPLEPLTWDDLELIHDTGPLPALDIVEFEPVIPEREGRHVLYLIWQRSDSPEAFYSCTDVDFSSETPPGMFTDDDGNTHEAAIEAIASAGITVGCATGPSHYCPDDAVSRGQMATFIARAIASPAAAADYFDDDAGTVHEANINAVAQQGITQGCGVGIFCPGDGVTRAQMASFISRALPSLASPTVDYFSDDDGSTHENAINTLAAAGITAGCTAGSYCPDAVVTRDQMASFLARALELVERLS